MDELSELASDVKPLLEVGHGMSLGKQSMQAGSQPPSPARLDPLCSAQPAQLYKGALDNRDLEQDLGDFLCSSMTIIIIILLN